MKQIAMSLILTVIVSLCIIGVIEFKTSKLKNDISELKSEIYRNDIRISNIYDIIYIDIQMEDRNGTVTTDVTKVLMDLIEELELKTRYVFPKIENGHVKFLKKSKAKANPDAEFTFMIGPWVDQ